MDGLSADRFEGGIDCRVWLIASINSFATRLLAEEAFGVSGGVAIGGGGGRAGRGSGLQGEKLLSVTDA